jgi:hypothetical protein
MREKGYCAPIVESMLLLMVTNESVWSSSAHGAVLFGSRIRECCVWTIVTVTIIGELLSSSLRNRILLKDLGLFWIETPILLRSNYYLGNLRSRVRSRGRGSHAQLLPPIPHT